MLAQNTDDASLYSADIVSRLHVGDSIQAVAMLQTAMDHGVVLEDLLGGIDSLACRTGNATLYRDYLLQARTACPRLPFGQPDRAGHRRAPRHPCRRRRQPAGAADAWQPVPCP